MAQFKYLNNFIPLNYSVGTPENIKLSIELLKRFELISISKNQTEKMELLDEIDKLQIRKVFEL